MSTSMRLGMRKMRRKRSIKRWTRDFPAAMTFSSKKNSRQKAAAAQLALALMRSQTTLWKIPRVFDPFNGKNVYQSTDI